MPKYVKHKDGRVGIIIEDNTTRMGGYHSVVVEDHWSNSYGFIENIDDVPTESWFYDELAMVTSDINLIRSQKGYFDGCKPLDDECDLIIHVSKRGES